MAPAIIDPTPHPSAPIEEKIPTLLMLSCPSYMKYATRTDWIIPAAAPRRILTRSNEMGSWANICRKAAITAIAKPSLRNFLLPFMSACLPIRTDAENRAEVYPVATRPIWREEAPISFCITIGTKMLAAKRLPLDMNWAKYVLAAIVLLAF
jgi:hypothetical protein